MSRSQFWADPASQPLLPCMYMATAEDDPGSCAGFAKKPLPRYEPLGAPLLPASEPAADPNPGHNPAQKSASVTDKVAAGTLPASEGTALERGKRTTFAVSDTPTGNAPATAMRDAVAGS